MNARDMVWLWMAAYGATLISFVARMAYILFGVSSEPPDDEKEMKKWQRRRRWLLMSEFFALPLFATTAVLAVAKGFIDAYIAIFYSMVCALVGFASFLKTTKKAIKEKFGIEIED